MEPLVSVVYRQRALQFEQGAYTAFQAYEKRLQTYFERIDSGMEAFDDLQYRIAEILEALGKEKPINNTDIQQLIAQIGEPADFESEEGVASEEGAREQTNHGASGSNGSQPQTEPQVTGNSSSKWSFIRSKNDRVIAGVCAGIAQNLAIDPVAVRLMFVFITILQVATLFTINAGILLYLVLWLILPAKETQSNITRKLFRDPQYRVIGGVCAGLAKLFSVHIWMIRILFLAPFLFGLLSINHDGGFWNAGISLNGISIVVYIVLWILTPIARSGTDFMLLNGDPINLNTIQQVGEIERKNVNRVGGVTPILRGLAYVVMILIGLMLIPFVISMGIGTFVAYRASDFILFSTLHKSLAFASLVFVFILPFISLFFGIVRRLAGYAKPHQALRKTLLGLHLLGWLAAAWLSYSLIKQHRSFSQKENSFSYVPLSNNLQVLPVEDDSIDVSELFSFDEPNALIQAEGNQYRCRTVWVNFHRTADSVIKVTVTRRATGANKANAIEELQRVQLAPEFNASTGILYIPRQFLLDNKTPYHFQHAQIDIYVPDSIKVNAHDVFKSGKNKRIKINANGWSYNVTDSDWDSRGEDDVLRIQDRRTDSVETRINQQIDSLKSARRQLKQEKRNSLEQLEEEMEKLEEELNKIQ